jgi:uracil-DNA glycosylase family 4
MSKLTDPKQESKDRALQRIHAAVLALTKSPLYEYRVSNGYLPVSGEGSPDSKIMIIGEAPGKNEAKTGRPFAGAAGKILNELLASVSIPREKVYITNIVKDRPQENRDPTNEEISLYGPFLDRQISIIQPKALVTLGRFSMEYILSKFNIEVEEKLLISNLHGKHFSVSAPYGPITILVLYHPAAAIYNQSLKGTLLEDIASLPSLL